MTSCGTWRTSAGLVWGRMICRLAWKGDSVAQEEKAGGICGMPRRGAMEDAYHDFDIEGVTLWVNMRELEEKGISLEEMIEAFGRVVLQNRSENRHPDSSAAETFGPSSRTPTS